MARVIATEHTLDFFGFYLPPPPARLLEVGCGRGELAAELGRRGYRVVALDVSEEAVVSARGLGVAAVAQDILSYAAESDFEAVLFASSLHHIHPLDAALRKARSLLRPKGVVLVEDFGWERADAATLAWHYGVQTLLSTISTDTGAPAFPDTETLRKAWDDDHRHVPPLHTGAELVAAMERELTRVEAGDAPYLYRSAIPLGTAEQVKGILRWEQALIETRAIRPLGLRILGFREN